jgi:uncharacterized protein YfiM (DUF2279 family)
MHHLADAVVGQVTRSQWSTEGRIELWSRKDWFSSARKVATWLGKDVVWEYDGKTMLATKISMTANLYPWSEDVRAYVFIGSEMFAWMNISLSRGSLWRKKVEIGLTISVS